MKEFMLLIRTHDDHSLTLSPQQYKQFLQECEGYITGLKEGKKLIAAQPLLREGVIISGPAGAWKEVPFDGTKEVQVGYYHILARDMDEAIAIAKENPEFKCGERVHIEVRQVKTKEDTSGYVYPRKIA